MEETRIKTSKHHFFKPILSTTDQQLSIPLSFIGYLKGENLDGGALLRSDKIPGRSWKVKVFEGRIFQDGWDEFAKAHNLSVGDFLVFRHEGRWVFHVTVFDSTACQKQYSLPLQLEEPKSNRNKEAPYFTIKLRLYSFKNNIMFIPINFARSNGLTSQACTITLKDEKGRSWKVNLRNKKCDGQVYISAGWSKFKEDMRLKLGDNCTFTLVSNGKKVVFEVTVGGQRLTHDRRKLKKDVRRKRISKDCNLGLQISSVDISVPKNITEAEAPSFTVSMKHMNFSQKALYIPAEFARTNGLVERDCVITLRDEKGRYWNVDLRYRNCDRQVYLKRGWHQFSDANMLKIGDVCTFKLVSAGENVVMEVTKVLFLTA